MPCCSKELSPLPLPLPSSSPRAHVRLSKDAESETWRRPAEQSQSHHLDLSRHSGEGETEGRRNRGGRSNERGGLTALDLNTLCV